MANQRKLGYYLAALAAIIFWSVSFIGTKLAYESFPPLTVCILRFAAAAVILYAVRIFRHDTMRLRKKDIPVLILSALIGISVYYSVENIALTMTSASDASLISGAYPALTALVGILFFRTRISPGKAAGIALAVLGVFILTDSSNSAGSSAFIGDVLMIFNGFLWAFYNYLIPRINPEYSVLTLTYYQTLFGVLFLVPGAVMEAGSWGTITFGAVISVLFLAVFCSVGAYLLYNYGLRGISATAAASIMNLMPVSGLVFSALILGEPIMLHHLIGGAIVIAGVLFSAK